MGTIHLRVDIRDENRNERSFRKVSSWSFPQPIGTDVYSENLPRGCLQVTAHSEFLDSDIYEVELGDKVITVEDLELACEKLSKGGWEETN